MTIFHSKKISTLALELEGFQRQASSFCCYKNSANLNLCTAVSYLPSRSNYVHVQTHKLMMRYCCAVTTHCAQVENTGSTTSQISRQVSAFTCP